MFLYAYWPCGTQRSNASQTFVAFKTKQKAAEFAINQLSTILANGEKTPKPIKPKDRYAPGNVALPVDNFAEVPLLFVDDENPDVQEPEENWAGNIAYPVDPVVNGGVANMDVVPTVRTTLKMRSPKKAEPSPAFISLKKEFSSIENNKTYDSAIRAIGLFETYQAGRGRKSILHAIQEVKVIQGDRQ